MGQILLLLKSYLLHHINLCCIKFEISKLFSSVKVKASLTLRFLVFFFLRQLSAYCINSNFELGKKCVACFSLLKTPVKFVVYGSVRRTGPCGSEHSASLIENTNVSMLWTRI